MAHKRFNGRGSRGQGAKYGYMVTKSMVSGLWLIGFDTLGVVLCKRALSIDGIVDFINECEKI